MDRSVVFSGRSLPYQQMRGRGEGCDALELGTWDSVASFARDSLEAGSCVGSSVLNQILDCTFFFSGHLCQCSSWRVNEGVYDPVSYLPKLVGEALICRQTRSYCTGPSTAHGSQVSAVTPCLHDYAMCYQCAYLGQHKHKIWALVYFAETR